MILLAGEDAVKWEREEFVKFKDFMAHVHTQLHGK